MLGEVTALFAGPEAASFEAHITVDVDHGRLETRYLVWRIEHDQHWVFDIAFDEDRACNRCHHGPDTLAIPRWLAFNVLRAARPDISIRRKRKRSGSPGDFARSISAKCDRPWSRC